MKHYGWDIKAIWYVLDAEVEQYFPNIEALSRRLSEMFAGEVSADQNKEN